MVTLILSCWELNSSTSFRMYGPSPPVNPFQNDRSTFGPLYSSPLPAPACCCTAGLSLGAPPQPASTKPAPAPALISRNSWRVTLRPINRPLSDCLPFPLLGGLLYPVILVSKQSGGQVCLAGGWGLLRLGRRSGRSR